MKTSSLMLTVLCAACSALLGDVTLVQDSKSDYDIIVRKDAPGVTQYAATELQDQLKKTTGVQLPIVNAKAGGRHGIYIGAHPELPAGQAFDPSSYTTERFLITELADGNLCIMGPDCDLEPLSAKRGNCGLLFGVYEFIERFLGTRWYAPGELGECIDPKKEVVVSGLPVEQEPYCWGRSFWPST